MLFLIFWIVCGHISVWILKEEFLSIGICEKLFFTIIGIPGLIGVLLAIWDFDRINRQNG